MSSEEETSSESSELSSSSVESFGDELISSANAIQAYQFEPEFSSCEEDDDAVELPEDNGGQSRTTNLDWCMCDNCQILKTKEENRCCLEFVEIVEKNAEAVEKGDCQQPPSCITQHPGFHAVCLNKWVLQAAWYQYKQQYAQSYQGPEHKLNRHIAYRQLVRWCWGILGKEIRVSLPSCVVCCIRAHFPPPGLEENFTFEGFHFADE